VSDLVDTGAPPLSLGAEMTIAFAAGHREALADAVAAAAPAGLRLDLGGVHDFDSSGVQLLLSARRSLAARGQALHIVAASAPVREALALFGLGDLLQPATAAH
jgi:anti-anti-sigma factor